MDYESVDILCTQNYVNRTVQNKMKQVTLYSLYWPLRSFFISMKNLRISMKANKNGLIKEFARKNRVKIKINKKPSE